MAFPTLEAAALSGATLRQLDYWRRPRGDREPLLVPEYREGRTYLYSYRDVLALRTFVFLRGHTSLQKIRRAIESLEDLSDVGHLSDYTLMAAGDSIVWVDPKRPVSKRRYVDLVKRPGQEGIPVVMQQVLGPFETDDAKVLPFPKPLPRISSDPGILGGFPVVDGTRVPYDLVAGLVREGVPAGKIHEFYPSVDASGARDAERFATYVDQYRIERVA